MPRTHDYYVYILASGLYGTLYIGVTSDAAWRISLHRDGIGSGFTARYGIKRLVYCEHHSDVRTAITREKRLKKWPRAWKIRLIEEHNPHWLSTRNSPAQLDSAPHCPACFCCHCPA